MMNRKHWLLNFVLVSALALIAAVANAAVEPSLLEMSEQMDRLEKQDFQATIDKANACIRARSFACAESNLVTAAKVANSGQDKKTLLASQQSLANERQQLAIENRRAEEQRQAQLRREEEREQAQVRREEEREARRERAEQLARAEEDRQSTREYNAAIGAQILQRGAENAAILGRIDRQTNAAINESNRVRATQAAERDRARAEREERDAESRREAARERAARAEAARPAPAKAAESTPALPKYQPQVVALAKADQGCPPGYTWHNAAGTGGARAGSTCYADPLAQGQSGAGSSSNTNLASNQPTSASGTTTSSGGNAQSGPGAPAPGKQPPKIEWGPIQLESLAICHQSTRSGKWSCNGASDNQSIADEPTLESALARQNCAGGVEAAGGPVIDGNQWKAYRCGHALGYGDNDITKRYGPIAARRSYMCPANATGDGRCSTVYDGQDKR